MDKTFGEIISLLLLDNIGDCPRRVFKKGESPDWISDDNSCGIEVTSAYQMDEMWASSLFGKKFVDLKNKPSLSDITRQCTFRKKNDFFGYDFKTKVLSLFIDNRMIYKSIDNLTPDEITALDEYVMVGSNTHGLSDPNGFANDTYKALESKLKKLNCNTEFGSFKNNILFVFCSSLLYNPDKLDDICRRFIGRIKESIDKFHFVYVCSYGQIFKFDIRCESSSVFNIDVELFEKKRDELLHSLLNYDYLSVDGKKLEIDLCSVLKNEALNLNIGPVK